MAKNYSVIEALEVLKGNDVEAKIDVIKRYPLFSTATSEQIIRALPEEITAKKVEGMLRGNVEVDKFGEEEVVSDDTEVKAKAKKAVEEVVEDKPKKTRKKKVEAEKVENKDDDFDWDDDEVEEQPKKETKKKLKSKKEVEEDDDWGDEEVVEEKPKKASKKKEKEPEPDPEEDDEEPWGTEETESEEDEEDGDEWDF